MNIREYKLLVLFVVYFFFNLLKGEELGYETTIVDFGAPMQSGFYQGAGSFVGDVPNTAHSWSHLIASRHTNLANNHQLQIAASFATNDRLFFRKVAANNTVSSNPPWWEVATRGSNSFSGTQTINGSFMMQRVGSPSFPNGLVTDSQSLYSYVDDATVWFVSEQDENSGSAGSFNFVLDDDGTAVPSFNVYAKSNFSVPSIRVMSDGRVGIGTTSPDNKLDVRGTIRAEEVIVETGWSDYVFEEGYRLRPLSEVEAHIDEYGHLPGMPSAAEVAENGVSVGDSQRLLLEKVEELTLYLLQQQEQLAAQKKK